MSNGNNILPYENEAQELLSLLKTYYSRESGMVEGVINLVADDGDDVKALLKFIKNGNDVNKSTIFEYAEELYDAHEYDED